MARHEQHRQQGGFERVRIVDLQQPVERLLRVVRQFGPAAFDNLASKQRLVHGASVHATTGRVAPTPKLNTAASMRVGNCRTAWLYSAEARLNSSRAKASAVSACAS